MECIGNTSIQVSVASLTLSGFISGHKIIIGNCTYINPLLHKVILILVLAHFIVIIRNEC